MPVMTGVNLHGSEMENKRVSEIRVQLFEISVGQPRRILGCIAREKYLWFNKESANGRGIDVAHSDATSVCETPHPHPGCEGVKTGVTASLSRAQPVNYSTKDGSYFWNPRAIIRRQLYREIFSSAEPSINEIHRGDFLTRGQNHVVKTVSRTVAWNSNQDGFV